MMLKSEEIAKWLLRDRGSKDDPLVITPMPDINTLQSTGAASIDLRLGTWFLTTKARRHHILDIYQNDSGNPSEHSLTSRYYVPFGKEFILHPRNFVLAATLEWVRMPRNLAGYITGRSSWGRRGLIIETAPGVHPGFTGCLTLELTNVGEVPIAIRPGTRLCQLFLHHVEGTSQHIDQSEFIGQRRPVLGRIILDDFALKLAKRPP